MKTNLWNSHFITAGLLLGAAVSDPLQTTHAATSTNAAYIQVNLVSNTTNAPHVDPRLLNAWGIVAGPSSLWVNDNHSGLTTSYSELGRPFPGAISDPAPGGGAGAPTGLVFNNTAGFVLTNGTRHAPATFLMATEDGTILAWNRASGSNATIVVDNSGAGAVYKGMAVALDASDSPKIFAADFHNGVVDIFDSHFQSVSSFTDSNLPAFFAPFNVRTIRGKVFVTFAKQKLPDAVDDEAGPGNGYVDIFDTDGTLLRRFAAQGPLDSPWGLAVAPAHFGVFSHALLVGNFGDGRINAYNLLTGQFLGQLSTPGGDAIVIEGLWGLTFEREEIPERECTFEALRLYFTAGPNGENDGLLGYIHLATPGGHMR